MSGFAALPSVRRAVEFDIPFFTFLALLSCSPLIFNGRAHSSIPARIGVPPRAWKFALVTSRGSSVGCILAHVDLGLPPRAAYCSRSTPPALVGLAHHLFACSPACLNNDGPNAESRGEQWPSERNQWEWEWKHEGQVRTDESIALQVPAQVQFATKFLPLHVCVHSCGSSLSVHGLQRQSAHH